MLQRRGAAEMSRQNRNNRAYVANQWTFQNPVLYLLIMYMHQNQELGSTNVGG